MQLVGIGIDWISFGRIQRLLKDHSQSFCQRILTPDEKRKWRKTNFSPLQFSKFFVAKEAFFKAVGGIWMGLEGFRAFDVSWDTGAKFQVLSRNGKFKKGWLHEGVFLRNERGVGAHVIVWA